MNAKSRPNSASSTYESDQRNGTLQGASRVVRDRRVAISEDRSVEAEILFSIEFHGSFNFSFVRSIARSKRTAAS